MRYCKNIGSVVVFYLALTATYWFFNVMQVEILNAKKKTTFGQVVFDAEMFMWHWSLIRNSIWSALFAGNLFFQFSKPKQAI